ncbi:c-type cytochrome [Rosistilla oblonga]|uniref:c-type cytochrome n=1 Tax=Rosistilla oblonga TaxID=2527990 RepID=UPI003A98720A
MKLHALTLCIVLFALATTAAAADPKPPRIFLDKSERVVMFQLNRLSNEQLVMVPRATDDPKYKPVFATILTRGGLSRQDRQQAAEGLAVLNGTSPATELLAAISGLDESDSEEKEVGRQLAAMLLAQSSADLADQKQALIDAVASDSAMLRAVGYAGLIAGDQSDQAWELATASSDSKLDYLHSISLLPKPKLRSSQRAHVIELFEQSKEKEMRRAAIGALRSIPADQADTFSRVAKTIAEKPLVAEAVSTLLKVPADDRDPSIAQQVVAKLMQLAEATPAADRTKPAFLNAMQLVDQLIGLMPVDQARAVRKRLSEIAVRVVQIHAVEEEMRYDVPYFVVQAGSEVQVVLINEDLMPHNLVITTPGDLKEVAELGSAMDSTPGPSGKMHVPDSDKVLHSTSMVGAHQREALTFTAPEQPGEYPYVCTFPRHWMRMYGVMVVVEDLDLWLKNPVEPKDPIGNDRAFIKSWTVDDFKQDLDLALRGRSPEIGKRIFTEASCAQCHKMHGEGGAVGPDLTDVVARWKGDRLGVLQEILDPSHKIDPKYVVHVVLTLDGKAISGIVVEEDKKTISLLANPESKEPTVIDRDDIDIMNKSSQSMMPKALMDRFTQDEIYELMSYLESAEAAKP